VQALRLSGLTGCLLTVLLLSGTGVAAGCPETAQLLERLDALDFALSSRTARFDTPPFATQYDEASRNIGTPFAGRQGKAIFVVLVAEVPVELLWKAVNDESHHALDGAYLPVEHSEVIGGTARGDSRVLFQYFKQMGVGRWWVTDVHMNAPLYERSGGGFWEVYWEDRMDRVDPSAPPMNSISGKIAPIRRSRGAWLLAPLTDSCTLVEHFSWSDPGGFAGLAQPLVAKKALRQTILGLVKLAEEHVSSPHAGEPFRRPNGEPLE
jgi:hypothetical protein